MAHPETGLSKEEINKIKAQKSDTIAKFSRILAEANNTIQAESELKKKQPEPVTLSNLLDGCSLEQLLSLSQRKTSKTATAILNSKLLKKQIISYTAQEADGFFRVPGVNSTVETLEKAITNKKPITELKTKNRNEGKRSILEDHKTLASYTKRQLREKYKMTGTSIQVYTDTFKRLPSIEDKIAFIDLLDAMHAFCEEAKKPAVTTNQKLGLKEAGIAIGPSLYGGAGNIDNTQVHQILPEQRAKMMEAEKPKDHLTEMNNFIANWPKAKALMSLK